MRRLLLLAFIISGFIQQITAQTFEIRTIEGDQGYLCVQMQETSGIGTPQTTNNVTDIVFQVKWLQSLGDVDLGSIICSDYEIAKSGIRSTQGAYYYQEFYADNTPYLFPENWIQNTWVTIAMLEVGTGNGSGTFEVGDNLFVATGVNIGVDLTDYTPTVNGQADNYDYPTIIYDYVWTGSGTPSAFQDENSWSLAGNWEGTCGEAVSAGPTASNNCYIPGGVSNYPENVYSALLSGQTGAVNNLRIGYGASINFGIQSTSQELLSISGKLDVYGTLTVKADGSVTVTGNTYIDAATSLIVEADANGSGSFIDNGTITYGGSGSAKVQTYLTNSAGVGFFDMHLIGPTISGATLNDFNIVDGSTYAYWWDESVLSASGWTNFYAITDAVQQGEGIGLSTTDNTTHTLEMTGDVVTGNVTNSLTYSNNHLELISNPYPSSVDFDALSTANSSVILDKYWIYDPVADNYVARAGGSGGSQYVQVGQGLFVETLASGTFTFTNTERAHSTDPFRNSVSNILTVHATGGQAEFRDEMIIRFDENATSGYDKNIEAVKWDSQNENATMIRSIAEDNTELAINVLPLDDIYRNMTSVPMHFECGYSSTYNLSFYDMDSFVQDIDIYLEDKQTGGDWIYVKDNPDYVFTATADDDKDRFVIHFSGPDNISESSETNNVNIYGSGYYAYVTNNTDSDIYKVQIYSMSGEKIKDIENVLLKKSKHFVSDKPGYYVVRVITGEGVYIGKILTGWVNRY